MTDVGGVPAAAPPPSPANAEILDRGYRTYDGTRTGVGGSIRSVLINSIQRALGLRRSARFKIIPAFTAFVAYIPAIIFTGILIIIPDEAAGFGESLVPEYSEFYGSITVALALFVSFVGPEILCTDRRSGMLGMYLASPLTRTTYLVAKALSMAIVVALVTLGPPLFLLIGYTTAGVGPDGVVEGIKLLARMIASGVVLATFFTAITMAASTLTDRKAFASAGTIMALVGSGIVTEVLIENADAPEWLRLFNLILMPIDVVTRIYDERTPEIDVSNLVAFGAFAVAIAICVAVVTVGYQRMRITK